jgi:hypothetical protein
MDFMLLRLEQTPGTSRCVELRSLFRERLAIKEGTANSWQEGEWRRVTVGAHKNPSPER